MAIVIFMVFVSGLAVGAAAATGILLKNYKLTPKSDLKNGNSKLD